MFVNCTSNTYQKETERKTHTHTESLHTTVPQKENVFSSLTDSLLKPKSVKLICPPLSSRILIFQGEKKKMKRKRGDKRTRVRVKGKQVNKQHKDEVTGVSIHRKFKGYSKHTFRALNRGK